MARDMPEKLVAPRACFAEGSAARPCRVLTYGDSLTAGYYDFGDAFCPYGEELARALAPEFDVELWSVGLSGLTAAEMARDCELDELQDVVRRRGPGISRVLERKSPFDLALIMAGTNDIVDFKSGEIASCVKLLHEECWKRGVPTVALTVPPNNGLTKSPNSYAPKWREVNECIRQWVRASSDWVEMVDTSQLVPFPVADRRYGPHWEVDGLHYSPEGSAALGRGLAPLVAPLLRRGKPDARKEPPASWPGGNETHDALARETHKTESGTRRAGRSGRCTVL